MRYLLYFFYLEWYWGFRLAQFIIRHEISGEKKYGIHTIGFGNLPLLYRPKIVNTLAVMNRLIITHRAAC